MSEDLRRAELQFTRVQRVSSFVTREEVRRLLIWHAVYLQIDGEGSTVFDASVDPSFSRGRTRIRAILVLGDGGLWIRRIRPSWWQMQLQPEALSGHAHICRRLALTALEGPEEMLLRVYIQSQQERFRDSVKGRVDLEGDVVVIEQRPTGDESLFLRVALERVRG